MMHSYSPHPRFWGVEKSFGGSQSNWQGPIWGISNYMVFRGLTDYGFKKEARQLAEKTIALFESSANVFLLFS